MTHTMHRAEAPSGYAVNCAGALLRVEARSVATVITVQGAIDWINVDAVFLSLRRFTTLRSPLVVDMSGTSPTGMQSLRHLEDFDQRCRNGGVPWVLVPGVEGHGAELRFSSLPVADSLTAAIGHFAARLRRGEPGVMTAADTGDGVPADRVFGGVAPG